MIPTPAHFKHADRQIDEPRPVREITATMSAAIRTRNKNFEMTIPPPIAITSSMKSRSKSISDYPLQSRLTDIGGVPGAVIGET
jgi:hypothetical protein